MTADADSERLGSSQFAWAKKKKDALNEMHTKFLWIILGANLSTPHLLLFLL